MQKYSLITILITISLLLTACVRDPAIQMNTELPTDSTSATNNPTATSSGTQATDSPPTTVTAPTQPTDSQPTEPDPNALSAEEISELQNIFQLHKRENGSLIPNFYNTALGMEYADARDISLSYFFHNGDQEEFERTRMTAEEYEFIKSAIPYAEAYDIYCISAQDVERILQMCFGLSLADMRNNDLEQLLYWEKTDRYYSAITSMGPVALDLVITSGTHLEDGNLKVFYTTTLDGGPVIHCVMILKPVDGGYHIVSNQEVKE